MDGPGSISAVLDRAGVGRYQWRLLFMCALGYFAQCSELLVTVLASREMMRDFNLSPLNYAFLPFTVVASTFFSSYLIGWVSDRSLGRRLPFVLSLIFTGGFGLASAVAPNFWSLVLIRCLVGLGLGGIEVLDFVVFIEFASSAVRGRYSVWIFLAGILGVLYIAGLNLANLDSLVGGVAAWRVLLVLAALPAFPAVLFRCWWTDESPVFLVSKGKRKEAFQVLLRICRVNRLDERVVLPSEADFLSEGREGSEEGVRQQKHRMEDEGEIVRVAEGDEEGGNEGGSLRGDGRDLSIERVEETAGRQSGLVGVVASAWAHLRRMWMYDPWTLALPLLMIWFFQSVAYWGFTLFLPSFLAASGVAPRMTIFLMVASELPGAALLYFVVDRQGRLFSLRLFLLLASLSAALCTLFSAFAVQPGGYSEETAPILRICLAVSCCLLYFSLIPIWAVLFVFTPEAYPVHLRATAVGFFQTATNVPGLFTPFLSAYLTERGQPWVYMALWAAVVLAGTALAFGALRHPKESAVSTRDGSSSRGGSHSHQGRESREDQKSHKPIMPASISIDGPESNRRS
uniref:Major facilitator superfamily (MFS) profile domain-containing protein n=1 Tax=Chromera velia CCMP2878 TaxID=1169474 RepID=A0A0G4I755_9ALVE|eukprot:Cvel_11519.t1-p1 / transcript=Cvel_11519.t1 / gene=Cvel_11519 / organism=Chromera_velia_CCMP2878 / gene_product=Organic cation/carnitine transporter 7, putative / transcript_product=Organic cation/carnitine transporter 7, putative / location=Cvel_scaffold726:33812-36070(-) / protein_length=571 / sequence_SO=supercontig / SO=protein_coding / is_pseudo=false